LAEQGRAVMIGTDSVRDSRQLAATLTAAGIEHTVLDALQDADEAAIVAQAGQPGRITVATRMAGRGTDIRLADAVRAAGGLHVICCQHNPNRRIDRQLIGRSARQGDPGSAEHFRALDADAPDTGVSPAVRRALTRFLPYLPERAIAALFRLGQDRTAARERQVRAALLRDDHARQQRHAYRGTGL
ncbi:preprotein translocase subunit SecA, partial [Denitromonas sp.]|uniref:preprotein translocase subunit SecA n=1 Tax=Denitromonas sp. TaxID=2734609 RepID=UPI003FA59B9C